ncbi:MAG: hypothetical protein DMF37_05890 [Verrucomicrobia bacterium]|nr:MAG: hypothetical protein DMF37_05890 [Verrucomicrobiota bacterium]
MLFDLPKISGLFAGSEKDYIQVAVFAKLRLPLQRKEASQDQRQKFSSQIPEEVQITSFLP